MFEAFTPRFLVPQDGNKPGPVVKYVRQFDHLSRYAPDMVHTKTKKNVSLGINKELKEVLRPSPPQVTGSQQSGKRLGFQIRRPNSHSMFSGCGGKSHIGHKRKSGLGNQDQTRQFKREGSMLDGTSSVGHFVVSAKDDIWVIVMVHRDAMTTEELAIWLTTVEIVTNVANLVI